MYLFYKLFLSGYSLSVLIQGTSFTEAHLEDLKWENVWEHWIILERKWVKENVWKVSAHQTFRKLVVVVVLLLLVLILIHLQEVINFNAEKEQNQGQSWLYSLLSSSSSSSSAASFTTWPRSQDLERFVWPKSCAHRRGTLPCPQHRAPNGESMYRVVTELVVHPFLGDRRDLAGRWLGGGEVVCRGRIVLSLGSVDPDYTFHKMSCQTQVADWIGHRTQTTNGPTNQK